MSSIKFKYELFKCLVPRQAFPVRKRPIRVADLTALILFINYIKNKNIKAFQRKSYRCVKEALEYA